MLTALSRSRTSCATQLARSSRVKSAPTASTNSRTSNACSSPIRTIKITTHANTIATGAPTITSNTGGFETGATLTASAIGITDIDGIGQIVFYWQVETVPGSGVFTNIQSIVADEFAPITGPTFTLTDAEAGLAVRVLARFKDGEGVFETVVSNPTAAQAFRLAMAFR